MATTTRTLLRDFALANRLYAGCRVYIYTAVNGQRSDTLATLYAATTGTTELENPVELDNEGKNPEPIYFDTDIICVVDGLSVGTHATGVIKPNVDATDVDNATSLFRQAVYFARKTLGDTARTRAARLAAEAAAAAAALSVNQLRYDIQQTIKSLRTRFLQKGNNLSEVSDPDVALQNIGKFAIGQCYLAKDGSNLKLSRKDGRWLFINGTFREIPAAGVTLAPGSVPGAIVVSNRTRASNVATLDFGSAHGATTGDRWAVYLNSTSVTGGGYCGIHTVTAADSDTFTFPNTGANEASTASTTITAVPIIYIYAYWTGTAIELEWSRTPPTDDATYGHKVKTGDSSRTLVGMAVSIAGSAWEDSATQIHVLSYFNRVEKIGENGLSVSDNSITATSAVERNINHRITFLKWQGDTPRLDAFWITRSSTTADMMVAHQSATGTQWDHTSVISAPTANFVCQHNAVAKPRDLTEGFYISAIMAWTSTGTMTAMGAASGSNSRSETRVRTLG